jgi:hypothetical protein
MKYQVLFGDTWEDVQVLQELPPDPSGSPQSVGWLKFTKDGNEMLARPGGWRKQ